MKVMCIRSTESSQYYNYKPLISGKIYDATVIKDNLYGINGFWERKVDFVELSEYRKKQLESIGI